MGNLLSMLMVTLAFLAAYTFRFGWGQVEPSYSFVLLVTLVLLSLVFPGTGAFRPTFRRNLSRKLRRLLAGWGLVLLSLLTLGVALKVTSDFSRIWFGNWALLGALLLMAGHAMAHRWAERAPTAGEIRNMVLVGQGEAAARVEKRLAESRDPYRVLMRFGEPWNMQDTLPVSALTEYVHRHAIDDVWIAVPLGDTRLLDQALDALADSVVDVHVIPDFEHYRLLNQDVSEWNGLPFINLSGTPMTGAERLLKAALDRVGAFILLLLLTPLMLLIAVAVRLGSPGPAIFRQQRHGFDGKPIGVFKFRTMQEDAPAQFAQARPHDQRVTRIGRWLRKTSLDELPQLLNVLRGEMSLVGPRPHPIELDEFFRARIPRYMLRNKALPGMTGWAQINGLRGLTETDEKMALRIEHDLWYIQNWSLWLDITILLRTPFVMVHRNAF